MCGGYCKLVHLARTTPTSLCSDSLKLFDEEVRLCFASCLAVDVSDTVASSSTLPLARWARPSLPLSSLMCWLYLFISSLRHREPRQHSSTAGCLPFQRPDFSTGFSYVEAVLNTQQKALSLKLDTHMFQTLVSSASPANKARMLSVSAPHASSWVSAIPSVSLNMHLDSEECQMAIRWWLGLNTSTASSCPFCPWSCT